MVVVRELTEEKVGIDVNGTIASTADTANGVERKTADFSKMDAYRYFCHPVNFDYHLSYNKLDLWARFQDFQIRIRNAIIKRQALDYITIGFNVSAVRQRLTARPIPCYRMWLSAVAEIPR
jgi:hypothetical protein